MYTMYEIIVIQNDGELIDYLISVIKYLLNVYCKFMKTNLQVNLATYITNGAKVHHHWNYCMFKMYVW